MTAIRIQGDPHSFVEHEDVVEVQSESRHPVLGGLVGHVALAPLVLNFLLAVIYMDEHETVEDILSNFLESLGEEPVADNDSIQYGPLNLTVARKVSCSPT